MKKSRKLFRPMPDCKRHANVYSKAEGFSSSREQEEFLLAMEQDVGGTAPYNPALWCQAHYAGHLGLDTRIVCPVTRHLVVTPISISIRTPKTLVLLLVPIKTTV
eukprot:scaffold33505_cov101-Skeletonema_dohrnii-CCMP3373.AAC.7